MRRVLVTLLALVVLVAMGVALWQYTGEDGATPDLWLAEVAGDVRLERPEAGVAPAARGTVLRPQDRITTADDARAVLTLGRDTTVRVGPGSAVQVVGVDETGVSLELEDGALQATVRPESGAVRVGNRGREVVATSGSFEIGVAGDVLQIAATAGSVSLSGVDATRLDAGQQVTVVDRHAEVGEIPEELLLDVAWPEPTRTRAETTLVSGVTFAGAVVRLTGAFGSREVRADLEGRFSAELPLIEGENGVAIEAIDPLGRHTTRRGVLPKRDTRGPSFSGGVRYDPPPAAPEGAPP